MHLLVAPDGQVLGRRRAVPDHRVFVARDVEEGWVWQSRMSRGEPLGIEHPGYAISAEGLAVLTDEVERRYLPVPEELEGDERELAERCTYVYRLGPLGRRFVRCAISFRAFLDVWRFEDVEGGTGVLTLGDSLWPAQETFVRVVEEHPWVYHLKNRRIGYTTIAVAYDAWVLRFRAPNARVHLVSRIEDDSKKQLLRPLKFGMKHLPVEMQLAITEDTATVLELSASDGDRRVAQAYAAKEPGRGYGCSHLHLDEWAAMGKTSPELPRDVWAAAEPTISKVGGTCHILCTGQGPVGYYADVWRVCEAGEGQLRASFIPATGARPEYTREWLARKKREMADDTKFQWEYPETADDALSGAGGTRFRSTDVDAAAEYARGLQPAGTWVDERGRTRRKTYVKAWDLAGPGEKADACVGLAICISEPVWQVNAFVYNRGEQYPITARRIEILHGLYPGPTVIEDNESGAAVRSFLDIPEDEVFGQRITSKQFKLNLIEELAVALAYQTIKWSPKECPQLDREVRRYRIPDDSIAQDCVLALAHGIWFGVHEAPKLAGGRVLQTILV